MLRCQVPTRAPHHGRSPLRPGLRRHARRLPDTARRTRDRGRPARPALLSRRGQPVPAGLPAPPPRPLPRGGRPERSPRPGAALDRRRRRDTPQPHRPGRSRAHRPRLAAPGCRTRPPWPAPRGPSPRRAVDSVGSRAPALAVPGRVRPPRTLLAEAGPHRLLWGSDWPWTPTSTTEPIPRASPGWKTTSTGELRTPSSPTTRPGSCAGRRHRSPPRRATPGPEQGARARALRHPRGRWMTATHPQQSCGLRRVLGDGEVVRVDLR